jgi:Enolase C-terminal domain-like
LGRRARDLRRSAWLCRAQGAQHRQHLRRRTRTTIHGFRDALDLKAFDIAQFDVNRVGGITAIKKIADMCEANDVLVIPHAGQMHNYHITMSSYAWPISEYFPKVPVEAPGFGLTLKPVDANFKLTR